MSVNLHDSAYELQKTIRNSDEYITLKNQYDVVNADESAKQMFEKFRNMQMQLQQKQMMGQEIPRMRLHKHKFLFQMYKKTKKFPN